MDPISFALVDILNYLAMFVAAISGAVAGIKKNADPFGVCVLAFAAACFGGISRDILLGDLPPDNIKSCMPLAMSFAGGCAALFWSRHLQWFLRHPVQIFDAFALGLFTALGTDKALACGITPIWGILLGTVTGVGGGMIRDILLARTPTILLSEIYATASIAGGAIIVLCRYFSLVDRQWAMILGAVVCTTLRCLAIRYRWNLSGNSESGRIGGSTGNDGKSDSKR